MSVKDFLLAAVLMSGVFGQKSAPSSPSDDSLDIREDGGYGFRYRVRDQGGHYGEAVASPDNTVSGKFGYREPGTGRNLETQYTAGERGFRAQGPTIHRRMDLSQGKIPYNPPVPQDSPNYNPTYSTYYDPNEDSSYQFDFSTNEYKRTETGGPRGQVAGSYSFVDDAGDIHNVDFEASSQTGFHVKTPFPDSNHNYNQLYFSGDGKVPLRGRTSIQRGLDGSYRFTTHSQDQRRSEVKDALGNTRGSYTYIDKDGTQRTVQYIAGPNIGYKIVNQGPAVNFDAQFPYINQNFILPSLQGAGNGKPEYGSGGGSTSHLFGGENGGIGGGKPPKGSQQSRPSLPTPPPPFGSGSPSTKPSPGSSNFGQDGSTFDGSGTSNGSGENSFDGNGSSFGSGGNSGSPATKPPSSCCPVEGSDKDSGSELGGAGNDGGSEKGPNSSQNSSPPYAASGLKPPNGLKEPPFVPSGQNPPSSNQGKPGKPPSSSDDFLSSTADFPPHAGFPEEDPNVPKPFESPSFKPFTVEDNLFLQRPFSSLPPASSSSRFYPDRVDDLGKDNSFVGRSDFIDDVLDKDGAYSEDEFTGFPPGVSIRGRVQSLDLNPFGSKVLPPGVALEHFGTNGEERNSS